MKSMYYYDAPSPIGKLMIVEEDEHITHLLFAESEDLTEIIDVSQEKETPLIKKTVKQLEEYFSGKRKEFDIPLNPQGTDFMMKDWEALRTIPYGETCSYKDIAVKIGKPKACRAVGMANNRNPISIIIPCHRVIGANGKMVGYGGGLPIKKYLLKLEKESQ